MNSIITKTPDKVSEQADVVSKSEVSAEFSEQLPIDSQSSMLETELLDVKSFPTNELSVSPIEISSDELSRKSQNIQSSTDSVPAEALVAVEAAFEDEIEISMEEEPQTVPFVAASKVEHVADSGVRNADGNVVSQTTITDEMPTLESFADVLDDLELELGELKEQIDETANVVNSLPPATILKAEQLRTEQLGNDLSEKRPETFESIQKPRQASTIPFQRNPTRRTIDQDSIALEQIASNTVTAAGGIPGKIELASGLDFASPTLSRPNPYAAKSANERSLFSVHSGNPPTDQQGTQQSRSLGSQPRAGRTVGVPTPTPPKAKMPTRNALSIDSLYDNADASLVLSGRPEKKNRNTPSPPGIPVTGPRLSLRKQVELLANAGFTVNQIAQKLGLSIGEIDLMLNLRR